MWIGTQQSYRTPPLSLRIVYWAEGGGWVRARLKRHCWLVVSIIRGLWGTERLPSDTIKSATTKQLKGL